MFEYNHFSKSEIATFNYTGTGVGTVGGGGGGGLQGLVPGSLHFLIIA